MQIRNALKFRANKKYWCKECIFFFAKCSLQSGKYGESLELTSVALKVEERELGSRSERLVELYGLMAEIYDEV